MAKIPSIDESNGEARTLLEALEAQYGEDFPDTYDYMAHRPAALRAYSEFVLAVLAGDAMPYKYKELAYLKAAMGVECAHCVASHSQYASRAGYTGEQISALRDFEDSPLFSDEEKAILRFSDRYTRQAGPDSSALVDDLLRYFDSAQVVELTLAIGISSTFGRFNNALGIYSPDSTPADPARLGRAG